jgi:hypothetical protein
MLLLFIFYYYYKNNMKGIGTWEGERDISRDAKDAMTTEKD